MDITTERIDGVAVDRIGDTRDNRPALLLIHGGLHGSWCFAPMMGRLADQGWEAVALNWLGRHGSNPLPDDELVGRSILDVRDEIGRVARTLAHPPILVGHSMGGLACLAHAAEAEVSGLILLAPVVPGRFASEPVDLPVDPTVPWGPPPPDVAQALFWAGANETDAVRNYERLVPESPTAVLEATRWTAKVDIERIAAPARLVAAEQDPLVPAAYVERLAEGMGAPCRTLPGRGHGLTLDPGWEELTDDVARWADEMAADRSAD